MNRESIYQAVFDRVKAATWAALPVTGKTTWGATSRKLAHWNDVARDVMPVLFQTQRTERVQREPNLPPIWTLSVEYFVYVATAAGVDATLIPSQQLNPILDAMQAALEPQAYDGSPLMNTLGKSVYQCKIVGEVLNFEGDLGDLGVLIVPVEILVPY